MMSALFRQKGATFDISIIETKQVQEFIDTHAQILDDAFAQVSMSDGMRRSLQQSNYIFSGLKTFHELNEAFPELIDENGNRKTFDRFLYDVQKIDSTYNKNYLRAEYNLIQASALMASKWEQFTEDDERYNIQYRTVGDGNVRPEHAALHGITLPKSDPFWEDFFPPNGFGCRCNGVQVRKSKYPQTSPQEARRRGEEALQHDKKGIFRFNPGKEKKSVPDYNPYTIKRCRDCDIAKGNIKLAFIPDNELCAACKLVRKCYGDKSKSQRAIERTHYLHLMEPLLKKKVTVKTNGHDMQIGFNKYGNKHLFADTFGRSKVLRKEDLQALDEILANAEFVMMKGLSKKRSDDIKRFYYYKTRLRGETVYLNVAETDFKRPGGKIFHDRFLYSVTDTLKK